MIIYFQFRKKLITPIISKNIIKEIIANIILDIVAYIMLTILFSNLGALRSNGYLDIISFNLVKYIINNIKNIIVNIFIANII